MKRKFFAVFISIIGLLTVGSAIFAQLLGIDHNAEWGRGRILLLTIGLCVFFAGTLSFIFGSRGVVSRENPANVFVVKLGQKYLYILPVAGFILLVYIWFASVGLWATWPERTAYYSLLARAFQNRDLHLPVAPSEKLLALPNPYDPSQRVGVGEPLDFSLYNGKFYLYWGPIPALILVALKVLTPKDLPDVHLVFGFSCGLFLVQSLLIVAIWDRFFERLPKWILAMAVLLVGLSAPVTWMLSTGRIYEVAITGGQFFLMAGFLATIFALDKTFLSNMKLFLAGTLWSLAIGSRLTLILPIGFMILMVIYRLWQTRPVKLRDITHALLWLGLPLLSGLLLLASYNWARFGSLTETGLTYQLAGTYIQKHLDEMVSYRYIIQNFYNYFLVPFRIHNQFPFIYSNMGSRTPVLPFYTLSEFYSTNPITGLIYLVPFVFFSFPAIYALVKHTEKDKSLLQWITATLAGATLLVLASLLMFFWAAMRYVADFLPMLLVLSIIGFCQSYIAAERKKEKLAIVGAGILLGGITILMSTILGISGDIVVFQEKNPAILEWFNRFLQ